MSAPTDEPSLAARPWGGSGYAFTYDAEGRRTSKVSYGNQTVYYVWDGDRLIGEYVPYESTYIYLYDAEGSVIGFKYKDETGYYTGGAFYTYYYEKNLQGDIVGIIDENGNKFVEYTYDAWGNMLSRTMLGSNLWSLHYNLAESNPFLYRGYYYDRETGFYYLRSRYYDPVIGRFINADSHVNANGDLIGYNMYAYCSNNPVMYVDPSGEWLIEVLSVIIVVAIVGIACYDAYNTAQTAKTVVESVDTITSIPEEIMTEKHLFAANALVLAKYPNAPIIPINEEAYPDYNQYVRNAAEILKCFPDEKIQKMMHPDYQLTYEDISYVATDCWGYYDSGFRGNMAVKHSKEFYEAAYDLLEIYWGSGTNLAG